MDEHFLMSFPFVSAINVTFLFTFWIVSEMQLPM